VTPTFPGPGLVPAFRALATAIVPAASALSPAEWREVESIIANALAKRPASMRRQLALFIRALDVLPALRWGRPFRTLDAARQARFLHRIERSPIFLVRRGFWGLRTLVFMGYYGRPAVHAGIGYDARLRGWLEHPHAPAAARQRTAAVLARDAEAGG
jgi:hypothetical protein